MTGISASINQLPEGLLIGKGARAGCSQFQMNSTTQGWTPPRMTTAQRLAIGTPIDGLHVFDITLGWDMTYFNGEWRKQGDGQVMNYITVGMPGSDVDYALPANSIGTAVAAAVAAGAAYTNPISIHVYPGVYAEMPMTVPAGVYIQAADNRIDVVFVVALNPDANLFTVNGGYVCGINAMGANPGYCLFRCADPYHLTALHGVSMSACATGISVSNGATVVSANMSIILGAPDMQVGIGAYVTGVGSYLGVSGGFIAVPTALIPFYASNPIQQVFHVSDGAQMLLASVVAHVAHVDNTADVVFADTGSFCFMANAEFSGNANAVHIGASGTGTQVLMSGGSFGNNTYDIYNESSTAKVFVNQSVDSLHYYGTAGATMSGLLQVRDDDLVRITGNMRYQYLVTGRDSDLSRYFNEYASSGITQGGLVTASTGLSVNVALGSGWVRRGAPSYDISSVSWGDASSLAITAGSTNYIIYNGTSGFIESTTSTPGYNDTILLATVVASGAGVRF